MGLRTRINDRYAPGALQRRSDLFWRFRKIFEIIADSANPAKERDEHRDWYVHNLEIEDQLNAILLDRKSDVLCFLVGHTGIGKSTVQRFVLGGNQTQYLRSLQSLVLHVTCDGTYIETAERWRQIFSSYFDAASARLARVTRVQYTTEELGHFIEENKDNLLYRKPLLVETSLRERVDALMKEERRAYELEKLKYVASKAALKRLVIVVDDLESLPLAIQLQAIDEIFHAYDCLQNRPKHSFTLAVLIALRPETLATALSAKEHDISQPTLSAYSFFEKIDFHQPVELSDLFKARFASAERKADLRELVENEGWAESKNLIFEISKDLKIKFGESIVRLANSNVRDALSLFRGILENRRWFQRDHDSRAHMALDETSYVVNDAAVLKALAMPQGEVYFEGQQTPIVNLLHNTRDPASDIIVTYVLRFLFHRVQTEDRAAQWAPFDLKVLFSAVPNLFPTAVADVSMWKSTVLWMKERKLLFPSYDGDSQEWRFSLTPRAVELWTLLSKNSLCLQFFREDIFRDMTDRHQFDKGNESLKVDIVLEDCLELVNEVLLTEKEHLRVAKLRNELGRMRELFGTELLSERLLRGLDSTIELYFAFPPVGLLSQAAKVRNGIKANQAILMETGAD